MYKQKLFQALGVFSLLALSVPSGNAANLNILWFTAATTDGGNFASYENGVRDLVATAASPSSDNDWNVTFWNASFDPFSADWSLYNVLVVASPQFIDGADYSSLNSSLPALGSRVVVTGMDADWHYMNTPGSTYVNGPKGFLQNTINWAGSGSGLGAIFLAPQGNVQWSLTGLGNDSSYQEIENIQITTANESHPVQAGLTSDGLSNWNTSAKEEWDSFNPLLWQSLQFDGDNPGASVTLASVSADPGTPTPEPGSILLLLGAGAAILLAAKRQ